MTVDMRIFISDTQENGEVDYTKKRKTSQDSLRAGLIVLILFQHYFLLVSLPNHGITIQT